MDRRFSVFSRDRYVIPLYRPPSRKSPGCFARLFLLASAVYVSWLLISSGTLSLLLQSKPLITLPFNLNGLTLVQQSPGSASLLGKPTLSASFVDQVLARAHSPAMGTGQALFDLSEQYGIDDAYALAFFMHESSFGTAGVARVTLSLGNIRCSLGYRCIGGYRAYDTWQAGYKDWYALLKCGYV